MIEARDARILQAFGDAIGLEYFKSASLIVAWHLNEARRFFGELPMPVELGLPGCLTDSKVFRDSQTSPGCAKSGMDRSNAARQAAAPRSQSACLITRPRGDSA